MRMTVPRPLSAHIRQGLEHVGQRKEPEGGSGHWPWRDVSWRDVSRREKRPEIRDAALSLGSCVAA